MADQDCQKPVYHSNRGHLVSFRVRYYETDAMGIVHHSNYLRWFELARTEYLRSAGMTYRSLEEMGLASPVIGARCRYLHPCRYDDLIQVQAWIQAYNGVRLTLAYAVWHDGCLICDGETDHAFVWHGRAVALVRSLPEIHSRMLAGLNRDRLTISPAES
ncbi:MAG TPA: acyl-CoA thioesterase [Clostridiales bacterium]|nr:acyl-CoA thioesterase [Clostridiales bacterium]